MSHRAIDQWSCGHCVSQVHLVLGSRIGCCKLWATSDLSCLHRLPTSASCLLIQFFVSPPSLFLSFPCRALPVGILNWFHLGYVDLRRLSGYKNTPFQVHTITIQHHTHQYHTVMRHLDTDLEAKREWNEVIVRIKAGESPQSVAESKALDFIVLEESRLPKTRHFGKARNWSTSWRFKSNNLARTWVSRWYNQKVLAPLQRHSESVLPSTLYPSDESDVFLDLCLGGSRHTQHQDRSGGRSAAAKGFHRSAETTGRSIWSS